MFISLCILQKCFGLPVGTYRLGIVLMSDDILCEQRLHNVELCSSYRHDSDEAHDTTIGKSPLLYSILHRKNFVNRFTNLQRV